MGWVNKDSNIKTYQLGGDVDTSDIIKALRPDIKQARSEKAKEIDDAMKNKYQRAAIMAANKRKKYGDLKVLADKLAEKQSNNKVKKKLDVKKGIPKKVSELYPEGHKKKPKGITEAEMWEKFGHLKGRQGRKQSRKELMMKEAKRRKMMTGKMQNKKWYIENK